MPHGGEFGDNEVASRGEAVYEQHIKPVFEPERNGDIVAIDILTGEYAVAKTIIEATDAMRAQQPNAVVWLRRIGNRCLYRIRDRKTVRQ